MWDSFLRKKFSDLLFRKTVTSLKIQDDVVWPFFVEVIAKLSPTLDMTKKLNWLFHSTRDRLSTVRRIDVDLICSGVSTWYVHFFENNSSILLLFIGHNTKIQSCWGYSKNTRETLANLLRVQWSRKCWAYRLVPLLCCWLRTKLEQVPDSACSKCERGNCR